MGFAPKEVKELVERFASNIEDYKRQGYNEAQVRREFIDPFFEALGWDVSNKQGHAEPYKDVIHEDAIKIGGQTKAPDYCFRIGGTRKFFLEAKKPAVDIGEDNEPAYQLRRYAWSAKLPLSILTDFEEFSVYDCQIKPTHTEWASTARIIHLTYKDYIEKWNEIAEIFSKEAVLKGSFDKFVTKGKGKRGTSTVDKEFLEEIERWRKNLATYIARENRELGTTEVNFAVQRIIDRILFLRMCEDRGIEQYGQLMALKNGTNVYNRLGELFKKADTKYNSGLFYFKAEEGRNEPPDELTLEINIPDEPKRTGDNPKKLDQPLHTTTGALTENGKFFEAAQAFKEKKRKPEVVQVYEKISTGVWCDRGRFELIDAAIVFDGTRKVCRFFLRPAKAPRAKEPMLRQTRVIPTAIKVEVWKRDQGHCVICGSKDNLHFDHDVPYSKGGSSITAKNVRLLCARHNLSKSDKIMTFAPWLTTIASAFFSRAG